MPVNLSLHVNRVHDLASGVHTLRRVDSGRMASQYNTSHQFQSTPLPTNLEGHRNICPHLFPVIHTKTKKIASGTWRRSECSRSMSLLYKIAFPARRPRQKEEMESSVHMYLQRRHRWLVSFYTIFSVF